MKAASVKEIRVELKEKTHQELVDYCLSLSKFKKENKELLTYLLFEAGDEWSYIASIKAEIDEQFQEVNTKSYYLAKKRLRKILRTLKKYIRYSKKKQTDVEIMLYFCKKLKELFPTIQKSYVLRNIYEREIANIRKKVALLHEDLQFDYETELEELEGNNSEV